MLCLVSAYSSPGLPSPQIKYLSNVCKILRYQLHIKHIAIVVSPAPIDRYQSSRFEGKSIVLDEAKILSKPIVATNYTTVRDQLKSEEGVICEMTPLDLAEKIMFMLENGAGYSQYLSSNNYGNADEIEGYYEIFG